MKSPAMPGQKSSGVKAANVVAVAAITGTATSPVAFLAGVLAVPPLLDEAVDVLHDHDRVVDQHSQGENQRKEDHHVPSTRPEGRSR